MIKAIYPGTFDPITNGHLDIIERASKTFDVLYVAVMINKHKKCTFSLEERVDFIKRCTAHLGNVEVVADSCLTVELAKKLDCKVIVRGIRAVTDYEYELAQATSNMMLNREVETYLMVSKPELSFLSSTIAKEIATFGGDIKEYIPSVIYDDAMKKLTINN
ncbi:MAG: pantetheine-phosphate adenylyltransferase [Erysipelotrichaceae bacterium]|nr:pantetheine-phosphate adenylyltransferase [Erysipelotrichaceae bacterium]